MGERKIEKETGARERKRETGMREKDRKRDRSGRDRKRGKGGRERHRGKRGVTGEKEKKLQRQKNLWNFILSCFNPVTSESTHKYAVLGLKHDRIVARQIRPIPPGF